MASSNATSDRLAPSRRFRAPLAVVGAAVLSLSMLLSVAPALGAANNGNGGGNGSAPAGNGTSGNVKVHDATTGVEAAGTDNEPHVCAFWLGFTFDAPFEAGTWVVVSWAPTGDGSTVASGVYDTAGDGVDSSSVIELVAGHYRAEWAAAGATNKKKTFWVDAGCDDPGSPPDEEAPAEEPVPPADDPGSPPDEEAPADEPVPPADDTSSPPDEEAPAEEPVPPADDPGSPPDEGVPAEEPVTEELVLSEEETAPADDETQAEEVAPTDEQGAPPTDEPAVEDVTGPIDVPDDEEPAQAADPGSSDSGTPPVQDQLGAAGGLDQPTMSDTAVPAGPVQSGLLSTIGLLALIVLHASLRRDRRADRDNSAPAA